MDYFLYILKNFKLSDFLDIVIISFLVYRFLLIIQGTRAAKLIVGLSFIMALYWASIKYELQAVNWVLSNFFEYFFLFLIVIFQEQIKTTLSELGYSNFFKRKKKIIFESEIEEISIAMEKLSRQGLGALIVIEKDHGLFNFSKTGTKINSVINSDLIFSFFQSTSPLHDGAIILFDHKIQSAGCFLPLSNNSKLDRALGTRHRASLGISEVSDAVAICLSEETQKISLAHKGSLIVVDDFTDLSIKLYKILYSNENLSFISKYGTMN